ncbi:unnamed protein product [Lepeophtheirus salmonis]|uniref:phospholipase A2 n=1 Tax=Lepeophtheirus salmonis TaxID=72036 RepID=A0A7R8CQF4_LEPSM|nr:unnamed protein product [Lepeophtheirus salmonis]CAF2892711.1 unnamed protein product [Lepeophtheirus salmonis]
MCVSITSPGRKSDIKNGGTPLHWATSSEIIEALTDAGCIIDAKNFNGKTALHIMIQKKRLDCALALIVRNASIDMADDEFGNTPLHDAVEVGHVQIIKALLVFNADPLAQNKQGLTPWKLALNKYHNASMVESLSQTRMVVLYTLHAVGASQNFLSIPDAERKTYETEFAILELTTKCKNLRPRTHFDTFLNSAVGLGASCTSSNEFSFNGRLLSLDGGGIKGLVLTTILKYMEKRYETPILHCFDWIAGTSTGGILALALLSGKTVDECQMLYFRLKDKVFGGEASRPYNSAPFDKLLQQEFGNESLMKHLPPNPKVMVTATLADRCPPDLMLFRNYKPEECFVDGGILSNNPSIDLLTEITEYNVVCRFLNKEAEVCIPKVLVSLGTGLPPVKRTKVVDIFRPNNATETFKLFLGWDDGRIVDRTRSWCLSSGIKYHRISPLLLEDVELDATDDKILVELMWSFLLSVWQRMKIS